MPQALPAAVAWATTAFTSAAAAVSSVGLAASASLYAATGVYVSASAISGAVVAGAQLAASAALSVMMRPSVPSSGTTLDFKPDPKAPVRGAMGFTALGGSKVFQATWGYKRVAMSLGVALSLGPIDAVTQFQADGSPVSFTGPQNEATGFYAADMWQRTTLGLPTDAALLPPTGLKYGNPGLTGWGSQHAAPQTAFAFWTMVLAKNPEDRDIFTNGVPDPRWIGRWMKVWNPRRDSTYPGGSGPQRRNDWRTWEWSENPYVHALAWVRGHFKLNADGSIDRTKRIAGVGAPDAAIDIPAFVEGMNVADANAWTISGEWSTSDGKWQTLVAMLQAGSGQPINRGAQISVLVNAPRVSTYTYTKADLVGAASIKPLTPRRERKNTIIPRYRSQAHGWEYVAAGEVTAATYRAEDHGEPRTTEVEYIHVRNAKQAGQLAAYDLVNLREGLTATLPSKVHLMHIHAGDCITVNEPELALANQKFVVLRTHMNHGTAEVTLELRSETDAKHAFALGQTDKAPPSPSLSAVDPKYIDPPAAGDWTAAPKPPVGGISQPIITIGGKVETSDVASVIVEVGKSTVGPWTLVYSGTPSLTGTYDAKGLDPLTEYWVSIRYVAKNGAISDRYIDGPYVAPTLSAGVSPEVIDGIIEDVLGQVEADLEDLDKSEQLAEVVLETILNEQQGLEQEASQRIGDIQREAAQRAADLLAEAQARGENIAEVREEVSVVKDDLSAEVQTRKSQIAAANQSVALAEQSAKTYADGRYALVQQNFTTISAFNTGLASTLQSAKSYTDAFEAEAALTYATTASLGSGLAATLTESKSYTNGQVSSAMATVYTKAQTDSGLATTLQSSRSYTDAYKTEASQTFSTKTERANGDASALLQAKAYTDDFKTEASLTYATQASMGSGIAATLNEAKSYSDGKLATAMNTVYTKAQTDSGLATTLQQAKGYSDDKASEASLLFATKADRVDGDAATYASMKSYVDAYKAEAGLYFAAQSSLSDISATAALALSTAQDAATKLNEARVTLIAQAGSGRPALVGLLANGAGADVALSADRIWFGPNTVFDDATDTLQTVIAGNRRVMAFGAPFGASSDLLEWWGPSNIALGAMTTANGLNGRMTTAPYVFDNTVVGGGSVTVVGSVPYTLDSTTKRTFVTADMNLLSTSLVEAAFGMNGQNSNPLGAAGSTFQGGWEITERASPSGGETVVWSGTWTAYQDFEGLVTYTISPDGFLPARYAVAGGLRRYSLKMWRASGNTTWIGNGRITLRKS